MMHAATRMPNLQLSVDEKRYDVPATLLLFETYLYLYFSVVSVG